MIKLRDKKISSGFTLVEVMLAAAILVIVLVGILATYISCIELAATAKNLSYAVNSIQRKIEEIRDYNFYDIKADYDFDQPNGTFTVDEIPAGSRGVIYVDVLDPNLLEVTISVCWRQRGNRIIGEDLNLNGVEDPGEGDGDDRIWSPAQLVTLITAR